MFAKTALRVTLAASLLASVSAQAATIAGLVNTGAGLVGNVVDSNWTLNGGSAYTGGTNGSFPIGPWIADDATSRWLTPSANASDSYDPNSDGIYVYQLTFSLAGFNPATASFAGRFAGDNVVDSITLNGTTIGSGGDFTSWTAFSSAGATFLAGMNTLDVTVRNFAQASGNPTGVRVEFTSSNAAVVPEPASWAMLIAGFGLVGAAARRRRRTVVA
ncbi:PEPxxWA-CTERM sorting domain-containing protein [Polymorphobacter fuscus]|uniref:PEPxxWA-CTERM sorting domain-containing protein n=1 Tax=Sandarakinorhabdus fusca TaxID=1439888 RepID=A0A7C9GST8_9SPHN|nr:PEPxxWA-CTERM sorting domain-containing protein [Polymorphobacter fuscus]KAB7648490.1 PEP-CTERM sorting domain-containing protein [Polymorphobacter fuscus]MQT16018.1 PEPxxWA-CTERM sorting domain-containing protein [Polymorphobacter fuscus]NJC07705.1 hypothetical protein [Polymorphobacter fuscus]